MGTRVLLDYIGKYESKNDFNAIVWLVKRHRYPPKPVTQMTIGEVLDWQDSIDRFQNSEAVGAFQIMEDTLRGLYREAGLTRAHVFDRENQYLLGEALLRRRGLNAYLVGSIPTERFCNNLAKEWASLPVVSEIRRPGPKGVARTLQPGQSYYAGDGLNKAHAKVPAFIEAVRAVRERPKQPRAPSMDQPPGQSWLNRPAPDWVQRNFGWLKRKKR